MGFLYSHVGTPVANSRTDWGFGSQNGDFCSVVLCKGYLHTDGVRVRLLSGFSICDEPCFRVYFAAGDDEKVRV